VRPKNKSGRLGQHNPQAFTGFKPLDIEYILDYTAAKSYIEAHTYQLQLLLSQCVDRSVDLANSNI